MNDTLKKILGIVFYVISFFLIIFYFVLEFSIINVTSPLNRFLILILIVIMMIIGGKFLNKRKLYKINFIIWFILYLIMLFNMTLFDKYFGREGVSLYLIDMDYIRNYFDTSFNLIPFATINNYFLALRNGNLSIIAFLYNIFGNILAFVPLAIFLPRMFKVARKWYYYFFIVSLFIIFIEFMQLLMLTGSFDIDDYILNMLGSMLFYFIFRIKIIRNGIDKILCLNL